MFFASVRVFLHTEWGALPPSVFFYIQCAAFLFGQLLVKNVGRRYGIRGGYGGRQGEYRWRVTEVMARRLREDDGR